MCPQHSGAIFYTHFLAHFIEPRLIRPIKVCTFDAPVLSLYVALAKLYRCTCVPENKTKVHT